jgi:hypothetical protein
MYLFILGAISLLIVITTGKAFYSQRKLKFLLVFFIGLCVLLFSIFPKLAHTISTELGLGDNLNTLIFTGFVILFMFIVKLLKTTESLKSQISHIVEADAVRNHKNFKDTKN